MTKRARFTADRFKAVNDTYGHVEGDHALKLIAEALRRSVDDCQGYIARLGGDEFVAVIATVKGLPWQICSKRPFISI